LILTSSIKKDFSILYNINIIPATFITINQLTLVMCKNTYNDINLSNNTISLFSYTPSIAMENIF